MADNPFDPKYSKGLLSYLTDAPPAKPTNALADLASTPAMGGLFGALCPSSSPSPFGLAGPPPAVNALSGLAAFDLFGTSPQPPKLSLADLVAPPRPANTFGSLAAAALFAPHEPTSPLGNLGAVADLFPPPRPTNPLGGLAVAALFAPEPPPTSNFGILAGLFAPTPPTPWAGSGLGVLSGHFPLADPPPATPKPVAPPPKPVTPAVKRKAFFSFHYDDVMRTSVVRKAWMFKHPDSAMMPSFFDSSLWESKKLVDDEAVKRLIYDGVWNTSAVCVLAGSETWKRRWVRYEIARAIVDGRGLLTVHLNSIRHHVTKTPHTRGPNPLDYMAVGKVQTNSWDEARYVLYEKRQGLDSAGGWRWGWFKYDDYTRSVDLPQWLTDPNPGHVTPLSDCAAEYDYMADNGHRNIGSWIDLAARRAGR